MSPESVLVRRPRLVAVMDRALSARLVLVTAPAGYGKSVLVRDWADRRPEVDTAWVDLNDRDNDPTRFWRRTFAAMDAATPAAMAGFASHLGSGRPGEILHALELVNDFLAGLDRRLVLVFDDFHTIRSPAVLESFEFFRDTAPDNVGMVLITRRDPPLGVARLRVLDELVEIRERDLRFTADEIALLVEAAGADLSEGAITNLHDLTVGWAAAIRLALMSLDGSEPPEARLADDRPINREIAEFFAEEVIGEMPAATRQFLLSTAVLDKVNASSARAVAGVDDATALLEDLAGRSLLTTRLEGPGGWFQYHDIFRRLLLVELERDSSDAEIGDLHRRAAGWYQEYGDLERAIPHAIKADDQDAASEWLAELSPRLMMTGRAATLLSLSVELIDSVDEPTIVQLVCKAEALHGLGDQPGELDRIITQVETLLVEDESPSGHSAVGRADPHSWESPRALPWIRSVRYRRKGDADNLIGLNLQEFIPSPSRALEGEVAEAMLWLERYEDAEPLLEISADRAQEEAHAPHVVHYLGLLAMTRAGQGRYGEARAVTDKGLALCSEHDLGQLRQTMYVRLMDALLSWAGGELKEAESKSIQMEPFVEQAADIPLTVQHALLRSAVRWSLGDRLGARTLLDQASVTATDWPLKGHFADRIQIARARFDLLEGDPAAAQVHVPEWRSRLEAGSTTTREWLLLMRLAVAVDGTGVDLNERPPPDLDPSPVHLAEWQRIRAQALDLAGDREQAVSELAASLTTTAHFPFVQPLLDERQVLGPLLALAAHEAAVDLPGLDALADADVPRPVYVEPLTDREQKVLGYMATHLSYPEIAAELYVSNNTVKSHCKSIFRKLAVSKRADAVARARVYGLID